MITPRLITGSVVQIGKFRYYAHFLNLSRRYEFTGIYDSYGRVGSMDKELRTELEVSEAINKGIIKTI